MIFDNPFFEHRLGFKPYQDDVDLFMHVIKNTGKNDNKQLPQEQINELKQNANFVETLYRNFLYLNHIEENVLAKFVELMSYIFAYEMKRLDFIFKIEVTPFYTFLYDSVNPPNLSTEQSNGSAKNAPIQFNMFRGTYDSFKSIFDGGKLFFNPEPDISTKLLIHPTYFTDTIYMDTPAIENIAKRLFPYINIQLAQQIAQDILQEATPTFTISVKNMLYGIFYSKSVKNPTTNKFEIGPIDNVVGVRRLPKQNIPTASASSSANIDNEQNMDYEFMQISINKEDIGGYIPEFILVNELDNSVVGNKKGPKSTAKSATKTSAKIDKLTAKFTDKIFKNKSKDHNTTNSEYLAEISNYKQCLMPDTSSYQMDTISPEQVNGYDVDMVLDGPTGDDSKGKRKNAEDDEGEDENGNMNEDVSGKEDNDKNPKKRKGANNPQTKTKTKTGIKLISFDDLFNNPIASPFKEGVLNTYKEINTFSQIPVAVIEDMTKEEYKITIENAARTFDFNLTNVIWSDLVDFTHKVSHGDPDKQKKIDGFIQSLTVRAASNNAIALKINELNQIYDKDYKILNDMMLNLDNKQKQLTEQFKLLKDALSKKNLVDFKLYENNINNCLIEVFKFTSKKREDVKNLTGVVFNKNTMMNIINAHTSQTKLIGVLQQKLKKSNSTTRISLSQIQNETIKNLTDITNGINQLSNEYSNTLSRLITIPETLIESLDFLINANKLFIEDSVSGVKKRGIRETSSSTAELISAYDYIYTENKKDFKELAGNFHETYKQMNTVGKRNSVNEYVKSINEVYTKCIHSFDAVNDVDFAFLHDVGTRIKIIMTKINQFFVLLDKIDRSYADIDMKLANYLTMVEVIEKNAQTIYDKLNGQNDTLISSNTVKRNKKSGNTSSENDNVLIDVNMIRATRGLLESFF